MHALSLGTWWIHITSVLEWSLAIVLIRQRGEVGLAWAMLPALVSAMAACTWHLFDNSEGLRGLVVLQASCTLVGNMALAAAAFRMMRRQEA